MKLNLYDNSMNRIAIIGDRFISVLWSEGYNTVEPFTLELQATAEYKQKVRPECYVGRDDRKTLMVIKTAEIKNGRIIATGKQACRCLDDVPFIGTIEKDSQVAEAIRNAYTQGDGYHMFGFAEQAPDVIYGHEISNKSILELMTTMSRDTDLGFRAVKNNGKISVEFYKPKKNENLRYSEALGNLTINSITLSTENLKNHAIVLGEGEGDERARAEVDKSEGGQKLSLIVDARDIQREEKETDDNYREKLLARGNEKLAEKTKTWGCLFTPLASDFGSRFDLGDILTIILAEYEIKLSARVARFTQKVQRNQTETTVEVGEITITR